MGAVRIGLISDTHNLLRTEAEHALKGVTHIIHAGDICAPEVLVALEGIAPVTVVRGNNDRGSWADRLPETTVLRVDNVAILVVHDLATLAVDPQSVGASVVVAGHSHRPLIEERRRILHVNPGSAGPRRFNLPVSVGELVIRDGQVEARLTELRID